jgi:serine/threonine-protein kinase
VAGLNLGPYRLIQKLATGGMGEVYVAVRKGIGDFEKPMAIKLLLPHLVSNQRAVSRFLDEARVSARMTHPNIAQVFDVGLVDDRYFLAMELVRGASLSGFIAALRKAKQYPSAALVSWVGRSLCDGLHHAHALTQGGKALNVVHRDVTPHNVLVSVDGVVKLADFGVALIHEGREGTSPGRILGKLGYMAPEQLYGEPVDARADVFGVGASLFELATLRRPFGSSANIDTLGAIERRMVGDLDALRPDLPQALRDAIRHAMVDDLARRCPSAKALREELPELPQGQEELGELVSRLCAGQVEQVDEFTRQSGIRLTSSVPAPGGGTPELSPPMPDSSPALAIPVAGIAPRAAGISWGKALAALGSVSVAMTLIAFILLQTALKAPPVRQAAGSERGLAKDREAKEAALANREGLAVSTMKDAKDAATELELSPLEPIRPVVVAPVKPVKPAKKTKGGSTVPVAVKSATVKSPPPPSPATVSSKGNAKNPPVTPATAPVSKAPAKVPEPASGASPPPVGFLSVDADPWAFVFIDGERVGETPLASLPVPAGSHVLKWVNPETKKEQKRTIVIVSQEKSFAKADLR